MKKLTFLGDSIDRLRDFPRDVQQFAGYQLHLVQIGENPDDWKPMQSIGPGVREIRIKDLTGAYRVIYIARLEDAIYVLHAFQKKTQKTRKSDLELAKRRLKQLE